MTRNQLTYWANLETARANRAKEQETYRANTLNAMVERAKLGEVNRHNVEAERETRANNIWRNTNDAVKVISDIPGKVASTVNTVLKNGQAVLSIL